MCEVSPLPDLPVSVVRCQQNIRRSIWRASQLKSSVFGNSLSLDFHPREIASMLDIKNETVYNHLIKIRKKLCVKRTTELFFIDGPYIDNIQNVLHLTPRGKAVFQLHLRGLIDKEIGKTLGMSYSGVRRHKEKMLADNNCKSMSSLVCLYRMRCYQQKNIKLE